MVGTPALARLIVLADEEQWRLALVGDHHQLQAVGRGGLFHELCQTCRMYELERIHRFRQPWEAAASLQLRHGDPRALDTYIEHGRVHPGTFDQHLTTIADRWLAVTGAGGTIAVVCSTNDHADAANAAIQAARVQRGQLDTAAMVPIGGGERAAVGDVLATRRNDRSIMTTDGEPIRNRELWHVTAVGTDGSLTVSARHGRGVAALPADYARQHVRLGYAATEHGYQGDTVTVGIELASVTTTRRGLYSGATRGTDENLILVVTESDHLAEARDVLERVLASERADVPATAQRCELAQLDRAPRTVGRPEPRCEVPDWFDDLRESVRHDLLEAEPESAKWEAERAERAKHLAEAEAAVRNLDRTAAPSDLRVAEARTKLRELRHSNRVDNVFDRWANPVDRTVELRTLLGALDDWKRWASGQDVPEQQLAAAFAALSTTSRQRCGALAAALAPAIPNHTLAPATLEVEL